MSEERITKLDLGLNRVMDIRFKEFEQSRMKMHAAFVLFLSLIAERRLYVCNIFGVSKQCCEICYNGIDQIWTSVIDHKDTLFNNDIPVSFQQNRTRLVCPGARAKRYSSRIQPIALITAFAPHAHKLSKETLILVENLMLNWMSLMREEDAKYFARSETASQDIADDEGDAAE